MILSALILFLATFCGGSLIKFARFKSSTLRLPLVFAGSFLFAITIIHILPELFTTSAQPMKIGGIVLLGFFFQQLLETVTSGVEHGHYHPGELRSKWSKASLLSALVIHSMLEGSLLNHESPFHGQHESHSLLLGILFHKIPAAFALMAILSENGRPKARDYILLTIFSISSPLGLMLSNYSVSISSDHFVFLFAFVSGNFLHISTTIFVESSPNHKFGWRKTLVSVLGALIAVGVEYFF